MIQFEVCLLQQNTAWCLVYSLQTAVFCCYKRKEFYTILLNHRNWTSKQNEKWKYRNIFFLEMGEMSAYVWWRESGYKSSQDILSGVSAEPQGVTHSCPEDGKIYGKTGCIPPLQHSELTHLTQSTLEISSEFFAETSTHFSDTFFTYFLANPLRGRGSLPWHHEVPAQTLRSEVGFEKSTECWDDKIFKNWKLI